MELGDFSESLREGLEWNHCITFFCSCSIKYSGRAESLLKRGDRIIIIKGDNTLLVHQPENSSPVNYMKAGTSYNFENKDDNLLLKAIKDKEYMDIEVFKIYNFMSQKLDDGLALELVGTEADMSDMIKQEPEIISNDFKPLSREEHTKFGFIDVFGHDGKGNLVLIECKRYNAGLDAVQQLRRYVEKIKDAKGVDKIRGIIASPTISPNAEAMLKKWGFEWISVNPPKRLEKYNQDQKSLGEF
ncbi:endonuclease NucS [Nanoarchaeota archaeon]